MVRTMLALMVMSACAASNAEITTAKLAVYRPPIAEVFDAALAATQDSYKIGGVDAENNRFATKPQFHSEDGTRLTAGPDGVVQNVRGRSLLVHFVIEVKLVDGGHVAVVVNAKTFQIISGSPKPRELAPDDPNLPGFVKGRADALAVAIYQRLKPRVAAR